jgi:hypothetical protein
MASNPKQRPNKNKLIFAVKWQMTKNQRILKPFMRFVGPNTAFKKSLSLKIFSRGWKTKRNGTKQNAKNGKFSETKRNEKNTKSRNETKRKATGNVTTLFRNKKNET